MKRLNWFIIKSFLGPLIATFFICMFILLMQFLWMYIDDIVGKGLDYSVIAELLFYMCLRLVPMALPLAVLLASIMTFGNLGENYELIACKASGISLLKVMRPLIVLVVFITGFAFVFSNNIVPIAALKGGVLLHDIKNTKPEMIIKEGVFTELQDFNIKVDKIDKETGMMYDIIVYNHRDKRAGNNEVTVADSGRIIVDLQSKNTQFIFYSGSLYKEKNARNRDKLNKPYTRIHFAEQRMSIRSKGDGFKRSDEDIFSNSYGMLNVVQLDKQRDSLLSKLDFSEESFAKRRLAYDYHLLKSDNTLDTIKKTKSFEVLNVDSLILKSSINDQSRIIERALKKARQVSTQIMNSKGEFNQRAERIRRFEIEWHRKFVMSLACLIFFFIGAPLGGIIRKGGLGMPVVVSIVFYILYYIISMTGERSAREGVFTSAEGMWMSTFIIIPLALLLTWQAVTDAKILSSEMYINFFRRFGLYKEKVVKKDSIENIDSIK